MVWGIGEAEKLQTDMLSGRDCREMFARNKEEFYGGGPVSGLTTTQPTANNSLKHSSHLLGHFPLMIHPLHPKHSETHLDTSHLASCCLAGLGRLREDTAILPSGVASSVSGVPARSERFTSSEG